MISFLTDFTYQTFQEFAGESFLVDCEHANLEVCLVEVSKLGEHRSGGFREPFSLLFRGAVDRPIAQKTYTLRHPAWGNHEIFLVPVGRDSEGILYQAIFN